MIGQGDINVYEPLCDMDGCQQPRCGIPFEGMLMSKTSYNHGLQVRVMPCLVCLDMLKRVAVTR